MSARVVLAVVLMVVVLGRYLVWERQERRRVLDDLSAAERKALFASTIESYRKLCGERSRSFGRYCNTQRDLLELFPECDTSCQRLIAKTEPLPTR